LGNRTVGGEEARNGSGTKLGTVTDGRHRNGNGKMKNETAIIQKKKTQATTRLLEQVPGSLDYIVNYVSSALMVAVSA